MGANENILSRQDVLALLDDVLETENLSNAVFDINLGSEKCDGLLSCMTKVVAKNEKRSLYFIIKSAPKGDEFRKLVPIADVFDREIYFYDTIYPTLSKFQMERNVQRTFKAVPKCYKTTTTSQRESIILEDIRERGFQLWNKKLQMDDAHVALVFKEYAKLHAISFAMQDQDMALYEKLTANLHDILPKFSSDLIDTFVDGAERAITLFTDCTEMQAKLTVFKDGIIPMFDYIANTKLKYNAISHGDCWCNNMMFKYQDKSPVEICLLDFQIVRASTPVLDLAYFYYSSASSETHANLNNHQKLYYDTLSQQMTAMGSDVTKMYPYSAFMDDWKQFAKFGFINYLIRARILLKEDDELVDINDIAEGKQTFADIFVRDTKNMHIADERTKVLAIHLANNGYI